MKLENEYSGFLAWNNWNSWTEQEEIGMKVDWKYAGRYLRNRSEAMIYWNEDIAAIFSLNQAIRYQLASRK